MSTVSSFTQMYLRGIQRSCPFFVQHRFSTREAIHRYVEPEKFKKHMLAASEPYIKKKYVLDSDSCKGRANKIHELEPLDEIYAKELLDAVDKSDFVLVIQHNYAPFQSERVYKNTLIKSGGLFYSHKNTVYKDVFRKIGLERLDHIFVTRNSLVLGPIDKLVDCVTALRKMPQFLLMCGCIEKEIYNYEQLQKISISPNLDLCRATLSGILETPALDLYDILQRHSSSSQNSDAQD